MDLDPASGPSSAHRVNATTFIADRDAVRRALWTAGWSAARLGMFVSTIIVALVTIEFRPHGLWDDTSTGLVMVLALGLSTFLVITALAAAKPLKQAWRLSALRLDVRDDSVRVAYGTEEPLQLTRDTVAAVRETQHDLQIDLVGAKRTVLIPRYHPGHTAARYVLLNITANYYQALNARLRERAALPVSSPEHVITASRLQLAGGLVVDLAMMLLFAAALSAGQGGIFVWWLLALTALGVWRHGKRLLAPPRFSLGGGWLAFTDETIGWASPIDNVADLRRLDDSVLVTFVDATRVCPEALHPVLGFTREQSGVHLELQVPLARSSERRLRELLHVPETSDARVDPRVVVLSRPTFCARAMVVALVVAFAATVVAGAGILLPDSQKMLELGALFGPLGLTSQPWRLLSALFLHYGVVHLLVNAWALLRFGGTVERLFGLPGFLVAYFLSGLTGNLIAATWSPGSIIAGASGAVFGLLGVLLGYTLRCGRSLPPRTALRLRNSTVIIVVLNIILATQLTFISQAAHVGGFVAGLLVGLVMAQPLRRGVSDRWRSMTVLIVGLLLLGLAWSGSTTFAKRRPGWARATLLLLARIERGIDSQLKLMQSDDSKATATFAKWDKELLPQWRATRGMLPNVDEVSPEVAKMTRAVADAASAREDELVCLFDLIRTGVTASPSPTASARCTEEQLRVLQARSVEAARSLGSIVGTE